MSPRTPGENLAIVVVVLALLVGGMVILSVPSGMPSARNTSTSNPAVGRSSATQPELGSPDSARATSGTLDSFQTFSQLDGFVTANAKSFQQVGSCCGGNFPGGVTTTTVTVAAGIESTTVATTTVAAGEVMTTTATTTVAESASSGSGQDYTTTNNQVQGIDELDIVKTDGTYLYVATSQAVSIIKAYPVGATSVLSTILSPNFSVLGISLASQRLAILGQSLVNSSVSLRLYDVSNPAAPVLLNSLYLDGSFIGARETQGYFYLVVQQPSYVAGGPGSLTAAYPTVREDGISSAISPGSIYYTPNNSEVSVYTVVLSMSMSTGAETSMAVLTGPSSTIYVSASNIYVLYSNFYTSGADGIAGNIWNGGSAVTYGTGQNSTVYRLAYSSGSVAAAAVGSFPGGVLNQYSMNEYGNDFMVATSRAEIDDVFVLNQSMGQVGALRNIAPGESIFAVRFEGQLGYVVTYQQVDPLFTISFADPAHPVILSSLRVTGFSDYLHPFGSGYLIGVGKDTVNSSQGDFSYYLGLKLSLFNVTSPDSTEVANYMIGARGTDSPVLADPLAFTFDTATNTMVIPVNLYTDSGGQSQPSCVGCAPQYGQFSWQGAYVFDVSHTGFKLLGTVTQNSPGQDPSTHEVDRSVIIGDVLYTVSQNEVMASSLSNFSTLATIALLQ